MGQSTVRKWRWHLIWNHVSFSLSFNSVCLVCTSVLKPEELLDAIRREGIRRESFFFYLTEVPLVAFEQLGRERERERERERADGYFSCFSMQTLTRQFTCASYRIACSFIRMTATFST